MNTGMPNKGPQGITPEMQQAAQQHAQQEMLKKLISNGKPILCKCGCTVFKEAIQIVKASSMDPNNPTGQDQYIHVPTLYCIKCSDPVDVK